MAQTTIQGSFLGDGTVTGVKIGADFISAQTALAAPDLVSTDEILVSDAGVIKRMDISVLEIAATQITASGTLPALNGSNLTALNGSAIASGTVPPAQLGSGSSITAKFLRGDGSWQPLTSAAITGTTTGVDNRVAVYDGTTTLEGLAALTFNGSTLALTGNMTASSTVTASSFTTSNGGTLKLVGANNNNYITIIANADAHSSNAAYTWPYQDGANNTVMVTNGSGSMTWEVISASWIGTGTLVVARGGTGTNTFTANGILVGNSTSAVAVTATMATKGHVMIGDGSGVPSMLAIGSNDQVLTADSGEATGVKWAAVAAGGLSLEMTLVLGS